MAHMKATNCRLGVETRIFMPVLCRHHNPKRRAFVVCVRKPVGLANGGKGRAGGRGDLGASSTPAAEVHGTSMSCMTALSGAVGPTHSISGELSLARACCRGNPSLAAAS